MKYIFIIIISFFTIHLVAQEQRPIELSFEIQMYPAGLIPGVKAEIGMGSYYKHSVDVRIGYNRTRRKDWGKHGDERGGGFGGSLGYKYYITKPMKGVFVGGRADLWRLYIDHRDIGEDEEYGTNDDSNFGHTKTTVFQPTGVIGYKFPILVQGKQDVFFLIPHVAAGWAINIQTKGEEVGQGKVFLWGLDVVVRI